MGSFTEALWLRDNDFNYLELAALPGFRQGGPNMYFFSVYPGLQALGMKLLGEGAVFWCLNHVLAYVCAGAVAACVFFLLQQRIGWVAGVCGVLLLCAHPMFLAQSYVLGMEMPHLAVAMLAVVLYVRRHWAGSMGSLVLAFYIKQYAVVFAAVLAGFYVVFHVRKIRNAWIAVGLALPVVLYVIQHVLGTRLFPDYQASGGFTTEGAPWSASEVKRLVATVPDIFMGCFVIAPLLVFGVLRDAAKARVAASDLKGWRAFWVKIRENELWLIAAAILGFMALLPFVLALISPRYYLLALPFLILGVVSLALRGGRQMLLGITAAWLTFNVANWNGYFLRFISRAHLQNNGSMLERSLEYEEDMRLNMKLAEVLDARYRDRVIVTSWPLAQALASPAFGYVTEPFDVITSDRRALDWVGMKNWAELTPAERARTNLLWAYSDNYFSENNRFDREKDREVERIQEGSREIILFERDVDL